MYELEQRYLLGLSRANHDAQQASTAVDQLLDGLITPGVLAASQPPADYALPQELTPTKVRPAAHVILLSEQAEGCSTLCCSVSYPCTSLPCCNLRYFQLIIEVSSLSAWHIRLYAHSV